MSGWPQAYILRPTPAELAGRYALPLTGFDLRRLQRISRAASMNAPAGLTAYFIDPAEIEWMRGILAKVEAANHE